MVKKSKLYMFLGVILILSAIMLFVYNKYEDKRAEIKSKEAYIKIQNYLDNEGDKGILEDLSTELKTVKIDGYDYIGVIYIPTLNLELPIMNDWSYDKMKIAPCRYYGSFFSNDLVICAHAYDSLFGNIKNLNIKDKLILTDINQNVYVYEVEVIEILSPTSVDKMINSEFDLTLYTCTYDNLNRVTVRLNRVFE